MKTLNFTRLLLIAAIPFVAALPQSGYAAEAAANPMQLAHQKVIFQVDDNDSAKWNLALNNAFNAQQQFGANGIDIEIVAYGPGINMLKSSSDVSNRIAAAVQKGIHVEACQNTMRHMKLTKQDMLANIGYVPSGVGEIIMKEHDGYSYVRP